MTSVVFKQDHPPAYRKAQMVLLPDAIASELAEKGVVEIRQPMQPTETKALDDAGEEGDAP